MTATGADWLTLVSLRRAAFALACCGPMFVLTLRGWSNAILFIVSILCVLVLLARRRTSCAAAVAWASPLAGRAVLAALLAPMAAVALSAWLRHDSNWSVFDAPARFYVAIPIFLLAARGGFDASRHLRWMLPLALVFTLGQQFLLPQPHLWGTDRMSSYFADPLVFGYLSLSFGLMCLMSINLGTRHSHPRWMLSLQLTGVCLGLYLSARSGSRTGWLAIPLIAMLWIHLNVGREHVGRSLAAGIVACVLLVAAYFFLPTVNQRIDLAYSELAHYQWSGVAAHTSVGARITFLRIAADLIAQNPWSGIGETTHLLPVATAFPYALPEVVTFAFSSGMHNQIATNGVRYGIGGFLSSAMLLIVPLFIYAYALRKGHKTARRNAAMGLAFAVCIGVSSLTTEVVDLKYTASLYALLTALLCGASLAPDGKD